MLAVKAIAMHSRTKQDGIRARLARTAPASVSGELLHTIFSSYIASAV